MSNKNIPDPVKPTITFDNYVIPETVKEVRRPNRRVPTASPVGTYFSSEPKPGQAARMMPIGLVILGTFALGVLTTLYFANAPQAALAPAETLTAQAPVVPTPQAAKPMAVSAYQEAPQQVTASGTARLEDVVRASLQQDVTRQDSADLIAPSGAMSQPKLTAVNLAEILTGLTPTRSSVAGTAAAQDKAVLNRDILATLRESVLSGTYTVRTVKRNGVNRLCLRVPHATVSQDQAADLLREAAERGEIELPEAVSTADGNFDADTLIFNLVQTSLANDGTSAGAEAAKEMSRRAFVASNAKTKSVRGERVYVVQSGDSLAYLSLQFYGKPSDYLKIYQANQAVLRSPDLIQVGQRLIIPG